MRNSGKFKRIAVCGDCGELKVVFRGQCQACRTGDPNHFWARVNKSGGAEACWPWTGGCDQDGYGLTVWKGFKRRTHRLSWELTHGSVPEGFVCHRCDNPPCCNPAHLWLGTHKDNMMDKACKGRATNVLRGRTHCPSGHEFSPENTYWYRGSRNCRTCNRAHVAAYKARRAGADA